MIDDVQREMADPLVLPPNLARLLQLTARLSRPALLSRRVMARQRFTTSSPLFGRRMLDRYGAMSFGADELSVSVAARLVRPEEDNSYNPRDDGMTLAPHASPLRQVSAARQGAPDWRDRD
ncbi:MAG TPA: hypothetical protein PKA05_14790 [Roseiflexaceae bacterium]|nr:hypothetical protein [Roseiflexaceae bacterium]HMP41644.1 hypothetical protein [Roseiflexaceae bacterium]